MHALYSQSRSSAPRTPDAAPPALTMDSTEDESLLLPALMGAAILFALWFMCCGAPTAGEKREAPHSFRSTQQAMEHDD